MRTETHTPGPWTWDEDFDALTPLWEMGMAQGFGYIDWHDLSAMKANARLISAAPDLLEALEACLASLERADTAEGVCCCGDSMDAHSNPMNCGHSPVDMGQYYAGNATSAARAAIAKATGAA